MTARDVTLRYSGLARTLALMAFIVLFRMLGWL
jgi:hypothetical protein